MEFLKSRTDLLSKEGELVLYRGYIAETHILTKKLDSLNFSQNQITMFGKTHNVPRLELWYGDRGYKYNNVVLNPTKFPKWLLKLKNEIEEISKNRFNSVLINKYRNGSDYVSAHQDNEPELGENPIIGSFSLGETRKFRLINIENKSKKVEIMLEDGDLLIMGPSIQNQWKHDLPKTKKFMDQRYNLTFRHIY